MHSFDGIIYLGFILSVSCARVAYKQTNTHTQTDRIAYYCPRLRSSWAGRKQPSRWSGCWETAEKTGFLTYSQKSKMANILLLTHAMFIIVGLRWFRWYNILAFFNMHTYMFITSMLCISMGRILHVFLPCTLQLCSKFVCLGPLN